MAEHHNGTIHLVGGMDPEVFRSKVATGELNPFDPSSLAAHGLSVQQTGVGVGGSAALTGEGNPED